MQKNKKGKTKQKCTKILTSSAVQKPYNNFAPSTRGKANDWILCTFKKSLLEIFNIDIQQYLWKVAAVLWLQ